MNNRTLTYTIFSGIIFFGIFGSWIFLVHSLDHVQNATDAALASAANDRNKEQALFSDAAIASDAAKPSEELSNFFASSSALANLVELVEKTGVEENVNVSINTISADAVSTTTPLSPLSFSVSAAGAWGNLVAFSAALESLPYDIVLDKVSLFQSSSNGKESWSAQADVSSFISN